MGEIRLGKIHLRWCDSCNVPILEQSSWGKCGCKTRSVQLTPPGDARPAFDSDIKRIRSLVDDQFGPGTGELVLPEGSLVLLNKAPDIDRMDEVIVDGEVTVAVRFSLMAGDKFLLRPKSALEIARRAKKGWVRIDGGAVKPIREKSASALAIGVLDCDPSIKPGPLPLLSIRGFVGKWHWTNRRRSPANHDQTEHEHKDRRYRTGETQ